MSTSSTASVAPAEDHEGLVEQGKLHALAGDHRLALLYYRYAMQVAARGGAHPIQLRHYAECVSESLERMGALDQVLAYLDQALAHYAHQPPETDLGRRDQAALEERRGAVLLKLGRREAAVEALATARRRGAELRLRLPLSDALWRWASTALAVSPARVTDEQERHGTFTVRPGAVRPARAVALPPAWLAAGRPA